MPSTSDKAVPARKVPVIKFRVAKSKKFKRTRAVFGPERLKEVNAVRQNRACLRCSLLKIACNEDAVCTSCSDLVLRSHEKGTLSFSGCIRTRLVEVSIFEPYIPEHTLRDSVLSKAKGLASTVISLQFASKVTWDLDSLVKDVVTWLHDPMDTDTSKVGTMSSPEFLQLISSSVDASGRTNFQRMIYAESLAYTQSTSPEKHYLSIPELRQIGALAGHEVLQFLDKNLKPQSLKNSSYDDLRVLFLLVLGTILAISYTVPFPEVPEFWNEQVKFSPHELHQSTATHYHLSQILAHYLVYLSSQLKLEIASHVEQFLLEATPARWHKRGRFNWLTDVEEESDLTGDGRCTDFHLELDDHPPILALGPCCCGQTSCEISHNYSRYIDDLDSTQKPILLDPNDAWPDPVFDAPDNLQFCDTELGIFSVDSCAPDNQAWPFKSQTLPTWQIPSITPEPIQDQAVYTDYPWQSEDRDHFMALTLIHRSGICLPSLDVPLERPTNSMEQIAQSLAWADYQQSSKVTGHIDEDLKNLPSVNSTPPSRKWKRKPYEPSTREIVEKLRRSGACVRCKIQLISDNVCSSCLEKSVIPPVARPLDGMCFQSPQLNIPHFYELPSKLYAGTDTKPNVSNFPHVPENGMRRTAKAGQKALPNPEVMNLLV